MSDFTPRYSNDIELSNTQELLLNDLKKLDEFCFWKKRNGIYIYGSVGSGKTMLMNMHFNNTTKNTKFKIHFRDFIENIRLKLLKYPEKDIDYIGKKLVKDYKLICLDEVQILDVSDAMLFSRLIPRLLKTQLIMTSNSKPCSLYKNGLQRSRFIPTIDLINEKMKVIKLNEEKDYRIKDLKSFFIQDEGLLYNFFRKIINNNYYEDRNIKFGSRYIYIEKCFDNLACWFNYKNLCQKALGTPEYKKISECFKWVFISEIPKINDKDSMYRFVKLIDILYDNENRLACCSDVLPKLISKEKIFERTASRIIEMTGTEIF